jgi:hypothetical protein
MTSYKELGSPISNDTAEMVIAPSVNFFNTAVMTVSVNSD